MDFELDERLDQDTRLVTVLGLCQLRLMDDCRWPWLVLVPQRDGISEVFDLTPLDQTMMTIETNLVGAVLKRATGAAKINIGAIGNIVRQLHVHLIARSPDDANWPNTVWGFGKRQPWDSGQAEAFADRIREHL